MGNTSIKIKYEVDTSALEKAERRLIAFNAACLGLSDRGLGVKVRVVDVKWWEFWKK